MRPAIVVAAAALRPKRRTGFSLSAGQAQCRENQKVPAGSIARQPLFLDLQHEDNKEFMATPFPIADSPLVCWSCHERTIGTHFCSSCGKMLQVPDKSDYFAMFEIPRKLWIEMGALEKKFLQLSWKLHPDNYVNATPEEREISLKRSSELNDAYRTLREPVARVEYLLAIEGARVEGQHKQQAPPELLEEVFELNESLDELREAKASGTDIGGLKERLSAAEKNFQSKLEEVDIQLQGVAKEWDTALDDNAEQVKRKSVMAKLNELLNRRSYIRNLVVNVQKELLGS
jgi:molecular chaperone HscB